MSLLSTWGDGNKIITQGRNVYYTEALIKGSWDYNYSHVQTIHYDYAHEYRRVCNMQYTYTGMDYDTAKACCSAQISAYTRQSKISEWNDNTGEFSELTSINIPMIQAVVQKHGNGKMYDVVCNVTEDDSRLRISAISPETLFTAENSRTYND